MRSTSHRTGLRAGAVAAWGCALLAGPAACGPAPRPPPPAPDEAQFAEAVVPAAPSGEERLRLFRNHFAVESVGRPAHHFTVWYHDVDLRSCDVVVVRAASVRRCTDGGDSGAPARVPPVPPSVKGPADLATNAVRERAPGARGVVVRYEGAYREVVVVEGIPEFAPTRSGESSGWFGRVHLQADAQLTHFVGKDYAARTVPATRVDAGMTWVGHIDIHPSAARVNVSLSPELDGQALLTDRLLRAQSLAPFLAGAGPEHDLLEGALAVARDVASGKPVPTMGPVLSAPVDPSLPEGYDVPVFARLHVVAKTHRRGPMPTLDLAVPLPLRDAVRPGGKALGAAEGDVEGAHLRVSATLGAMAAAPPDRGPPPPEPWRSVQLTLTVRVEDDRGNVVERSYPARGNVAIEGPAAATIGLVLPGTSGPSPEAKALEMTLPGNASAGAIELKLHPGVSPDLRRRN